MEVTLKDESDVPVSSILEKSIALTNEVQVKLEPPVVGVLENATPDLETVPENKVLNVDQGDQVPVGEKFVSAMNSAVTAVVDGVKGLVDQVKPNKEPETVIAPVSKVIPTNPNIEIPTMKSLAGESSSAQSLPDALSEHSTVDENCSKSLPDDISGNAPLDISLPDGVKVEHLTPTVCLVQEKFIVEAVQVRLIRFASQSFWNPT